MKKVFSFPKRKGFTLIELMVVISIISLLASVVLVYVDKVRIKARDAQRISDMHQLDVNLKVYVDSYGKYPSREALEVTGDVDWCSGNAPIFWNAFTRAIGFSQPIYPPTSAQPGYCYSAANTGEAPVSVILDHAPGPGPFGDDESGCIQLINGGMLYTRFEDNNNALLSKDSGVSSNWYEITDGYNIPFPGCDTGWTVVQ